MLNNGQKGYGNKNKTKHKESKRNTIIIFIKIFVISLVLTLLVNKYLFLKVNVPTESMEPTLNVGDKLLVTNIFNLDNLQFGDIVVFYSKELNEYMVKRLIGLPGDSVSMDKGKLFVNGQYKKEEYIKFNDDYSGEFKVEDEKYFFLGDNRAISLDSRLWNESYINGQDIIGVVRFRLYPFKDIGSIK
ncbi:MAG: signal peptidase I [Clostridium sp.]